MAVIAEFRSAALPAEGKVKQEKKQEQKQEKQETPEEDKKQNGSNPDGKDET